MIRKIKLLLLIFSILFIFANLNSEATSSLAELKAENELANRIEDIVKPFVGECIVGVDLDLKYNLFEAKSSDFKYDPSMSLPGLPVGKTDNKIVETDLKDVIPTEILRKKISVKVPLKTSQTLIIFLENEIRDIITINEVQGDILDIKTEAMLAEMSKPKANNYQLYFFIIVIFLMFLLLNNIRSGMRIIAKSMRKIKVSNIEAISSAKMPDVIQTAQVESSHPKVPLEPLKVRVLKDEEDDAMPTRFDFLEELSDENMAEILEEETPEDIAFILSQISPSKAGNFFQHVTKNRNQIIQAMLSNQTKLKLDLKILVVGLYNKYLEVMEKEAIQLEGVGLLAKIINNSNFEVSQNLYDSIQLVDSYKAKEISDKVFLLEDILVLSNVQIEQISLELTHLELVKFLASVNSKIKSKFYSQLSERAIMIIKEDIESYGELSKKEKNTILNYSLRKIRQILSF